MGPVLKYHFASIFGQKNGYLRWTDELPSFDWTDNSDELVQSPIGVGLGRVFAIGKQPVNMFLAGQRPLPRLRPDLGHQAQRQVPVPGRRALRRRIPLS